MKEATPLTTTSFWTQSEWNKILIELITNWSTAFDWFCCWTVSSIYRTEGTYWDTSKLNWLVLTTQTNHISSNIIDNENDRIVLVLFYLKKTNYRLPLKKKHRRICYWRHCHALSMWYFIKSTQLIEAKREWVVVVFSTNYTHDSKCRKLHLKFVECL